MYPAFQTSVYVKVVSKHDIWFICVFHIDINVAVVNFRLIETRKPFLFGLHGHSPDNSVTIDDSVYYKCVFMGIKWANVGEFNSTLEPFGHFNRTIVLRHWEEIGFGCMIFPLAFHHRNCHFGRLLWMHERLSNRPDWVVF